MYYARALTLILLLVSIMGCQTVQLQENQLISRTETAQKLAVKGDLAPLILQTDGFQLQSYYRMQDRSLPLRIYIEGDGIDGDDATWSRRLHLAGDPTPINPVALALAAEDSYPNVLYIARPCQYITTANCSAQYGFNKRLSLEVINATNQAISNVTRHFKPSGIELFGFSEGAAVAILVAPKRQDVNRIITIAGNLDHESVNSYHHAESLSGSLNAIDYAKQVNLIPQHHLIGSEDQIIPESIVITFIETSQPTNKIKLSRVQGVTHSQGWQQQWAYLLKQL